MIQCCILLYSVTKIHCRLYLTFYNKRFLVHEIKAKHDPMILCVYRNLKRTLLTLFKQQMSEWSEVSVLVQAFGILYICLSVSPTTAKRLDRLMIFSWMFLIPWPSNVRMYTIFSIFISWKMFKKLKPRRFSQCVTYHKVGRRCYVLQSTQLFT